jgi:hypothetical protein
MPHMEKSHRECVTKSRSVQGVSLSLSPPPLKTLHKLLCPWICKALNTLGTTPAIKLVGHGP